MNEELLKYQIAITLIPGVGDVLARNLISYCGGVEAVFRQKKAHLLKVPDIGPVVAEAIVRQDVFRRAEEEVAFIKRFKIKPLFYLDADYPSRLKHCYDAPVMLFYKGNEDLNNRKVIAVVGTRNATEYGRLVCEELIRDLEATGALIVSGLAYGIDIHAHKMALKHSLPTVGVVGHGLDRIYPAAHKTVAEKMISNGGILTEFMSGILPNPENFPARNRIVAGMSDAVVIVEAAEKGGALITAEIANTYNRDVFAVPGKISDTYSQGCNWLIKTHKAALIESAKDIAYILGWEETEKAPARAQQQLLLELSGEEKLILDILEEGPLSIDVIALKAAMPVSKVSSLLLNMEFQGAVKSLPGKVYRHA